MTIFLRPHPKNKPVKYLESIELSGLVVHPQNSIAMYTSRSGSNIGPTGATGPAGTDQNSLYDTIIASCSDEDSQITVSALAKTTFRAPYAMDLNVSGNEGYIRASLTNAPTGSQMTIQITMNGSMMFSTDLTIDANEKTSVTAAVPAVLDITDIPDDAEFKVYIAQIGSISSGTGLKVALTGIKVAP